MWHDRDISAGTEWKQEISQQLNEARIILLLVSPDFISSEYCFSVEMNRALERHKRKEAIVIPIILRPVDWQGVLGELLALPTDAKPVTQWPKRDQAFLDIARGIRTTIEKINPTPDRDTQQACDPFTEYRITDKHIGRGVWTTREAKSSPYIKLSNEKTDPRTCSFTAKTDDICIIEGPLLREPLRPGKYRATFRYKVHDVDVQAPERHLLTMVVLSHIGGHMGPDYYKYLAWRTLTTSDFTRKDDYKDFSLDFEVYSTMGGGEQSVEFCTISLESGIRATFDSVRLSRR